MILRSDVSMIRREAESIHISQIGGGSVAHIYAPLRYYLIIYFV